MLELLVVDGPPRKLVCRNLETYTFVWPYLFSKRVPAARPLCRWAARRGAAVCGGLEIRRRGDDSLALVARRDLPGGTPLLSVPLRLCPAVAVEAGLGRTAYGRGQEPLERLAELLARQLHDRRGAQRPYLEFLHDLYNADADDAVAMAGDAALAAQLEALYDGNALMARGAANAPFISRAALRTPEARVFCGKMHRLARALEQRLPHFAASSAAWALSMALARAVRDDADGLVMYPLIDFCRHAYRPNAALHVTVGDSVESQRLGVRGHDAAQPCAHLVAAADIPCGAALTRLFDATPAQTTAQREYWLLRWGFVPSSGDE